MATAGGLVAAAELAGGAHQTVENDPKCTTAGGGLPRVTRERRTEARRSRLARLDRARPGGRPRRLLHEAQVRRACAVSSDPHTPAVAANNQTRRVAPPRASATGRDAKPTHRLGALRGRTPVTSASPRGSSPSTRGRSERHRGCACATRRGTPRPTRRMRPSAARSPRRRTRRFTSSF